MVLHFYYWGEIHIWNKIKERKRLIILCAVLGTLSFILERYFPIKYIGGKWDLPVSEYMKIVGLDKIELDGYVFYYDTESSKEQINEVKESIEEEKDEISNLIKINSDEKPKVTITEDFRGLTNPDELLGYISEDKVINILNDEKSYNEAYCTISDVAIHEYTHWAMIVRGEELRYETLNLPDWFVEGTAYYVEMKSNDEKIYQGAELDKPLSEMKEKIEVEDVYGAIVFIDYLVENYGAESIDKIIIESKNKPLEEAIEKVTDESINEISNKLYGINY